MTKEQKKIINDALDAIDYTQNYIASVNEAILIAATSFELKQPPIVKQLVKAYEKLDDSASKMYQMLEKDN